MERDVREFLKEIGREELVARGVLYEGHVLIARTQDIPPTMGGEESKGSQSRITDLLRAGSVKPLQDLMRERNVTRLVAEDQGWFLTHDGEFKNPKSAELKEGNVRDLENPGSVFTRQNRHINPFFEKESSKVERDVREFLEEIGREELVARGVLKPIGGTYQLRGTSIGPLQDLMREHDVARLVGFVAGSRKWFFGVDGEFSNPASEEIKTGNVSQLLGKGNVFNYTNEHINPFFKRKSKEPSGDQEDPPTSFALERDLQNALRGNIEQLERGLRITDGGTERTVDAGRIDITAEDGGGNLVVIELKAGTTGMDSIGQILSYMGSIESPEGKDVRGILVAYDFDERLVMAAKAVPNISLKAYSVQFTFEDRG